ncbi:MAG: trigger factor [Phycisphaeraceae bacterium]|nr:trigger factor [Phycisphaeraceae bacterium]MCW5755174.1 trigger factor [Phycisphaeraceae bacterium]
MSDTAAIERPNTVRIEDAGPSRKKLFIEIPAETVDEKLSDSLDTLAVEAQLPGFRKGRAPRQLIQKRFGKDIQREAKSAIVATAFQKAVEDHKLKVVGDPIAEKLGETELVHGKPLTIEIDVEVMPEFELPSLDGIAVRKPTFEVTDQMVDDELRKICINEGELEERQNPEPGDYLTGHGIMTGGDDNKEFYNINGAVVQVPPPDKNGKGMILGVMVDDFSSQLGLPTPGANVTIKVKGPENHEVEDIRGKDLTITFKVDRVDRILPADEQAVCERYGYENLDQLKETIRSRLTQRAIIQQQVAMRQQIAKHLIDNTSFELPERLTDRQATRTLDRRRMELMYRGVPAMEIEHHMAELRAASAEAARSELKLFFILNAVADQLDVKVTDAEMNGRIAQMAMEQGVRPEKLRQDIISGNRAGQVYQQIREHKAMDAILAKAQITDISADEYNKTIAKA